MQLLDEKPRHYHTRNEIKAPFPALECRSELFMAGGEYFNGRQCYLGFLGLCDVAYVHPPYSRNTRVVNSIRTCKGEN